jgi:hypothetical protein
MIRSMYIAVGAALIALAVGCGAPPISSRAAASSAPPVAAATAPAGVTCGGLTPDITKVVSDLKTDDAAEQEAWVSGGDSADLQTLINDTASATSGADQLNTDAATFNTDATNYLSDNSPDLYPGWQTGYDQVRADINSLATDCGLPTAPKPSFN